jgi:hypothetical protein
MLLNKIKENRKADFKKANIGQSVVKQEILIRFLAKDATNYQKAYMATKTTKTKEHQLHTNATCFS